MNQSTKNYLGDDDQEDDYINDDLKHYCSEEDCDNENDNMENQPFPRQEELQKSVIDMKNDIYMDIFQTGDAEKVHDPIILNKYLELIDRIWIAVAHDRPINLDDQSSSVRSSIKRFIEILQNHLQEPNSEMDKEMRSQFLHLHLHCYPYCMNDRCLSSD